MYIYFFVTKGSNLSIRNNVDIFFQEYTVKYLFLYKGHPLKNDNFRKYIKSKFLK